MHHSSKVYIVRGDQDMKNGLPVIPADEDEQTLESQVTSTIGEEPDLA